MMGAEADDGIENENRSDSTSEFRNRYLRPHGILNQVTHDQRDEQVERRGLTDDTLPAHPCHGKQVEISDQRTRGYVRQAHSCLTPMCSGVSVLFSGGGSLS